MSDQLVDMRNMQFVLKEVLNAPDLSESDPYTEHSEEVLDMILDAGYRLAREVFWPSYQSNDREGATFKDGKVSVPKALHEIFRQSAEGGWAMPSAKVEYGGLQLPLTYEMAAKIIMAAGDSSAGMYTQSGALSAFLINLYGSEEQKAMYMEKLVMGEWAGTMCLSEPEVGSALGDLTTSAVKAPDGDHYLLKGTKRWITSGDHDLTGNIIHTCLARIEGAPAGSRGISLFIVPKYRINSDGTTGEFNDVNTAGIEHKLGLRCQATATLNLGENEDCHGWLLGEENLGLKHMLSLVNMARLSVGSQSVGAASTAYHIALQYATERRQGRKVSNPDPTTPPVAIIEHADVRQMLLWQKAYVEGCMSLILYSTNLQDKIITTEDVARKAHYEDLLGAVTPTAKAYSSEICFDSIRLAIQVLGGAGFTEDFPLAQLLRDSKVFSIYEGTTGIQGLDLLGRRLMRNEGSAFKAILGEIQKTIERASQQDRTKNLALRLGKALDALVGTTMHLSGHAAKGDADMFTCNATLYLKCYSEVIIAWQHLWQASVAQEALENGTEEETFYQAKIATASFYINNVLATTEANLGRIMDDERTALDFPVEWFGAEVVAESLT